MPLLNTPRSYGSLAKLLHWGIVALILVQFYLAESADELPDGAEKLAVIARHKSLGVLLLALAVLRIGWKLANRGRPMPAGSGVLRKAAAAGHGLLYLLLLAQPISGWAMASAAGAPVAFFGRFALPALAPQNRALHERLGDVHETLFWVLAAVAALHAAAALYHHFALKDDVLKRMSPFGRPAAEVRGMATPRRRNDGIDP